MSTILRALKKLENDSRQIEENPSLDSRFVSLADTGPRRSTFSFFFMAGTGIICGLVVLAGWYFFSGRHQPLTPETEVISRPHPKSVPTPQSESSDVSRAPENGTTHPAEEISLQEPAWDLPAAEPESAEAVARAELTHTVDSRNDVLHTDRVTPQEATTLGETVAVAADEVVQLPTDPAVVFAGSSNEPAVDTPPTETKIPKLTDPDMRLQAITWSREPEKRIAVINNRIVRENDSVSGYLISTINQDDVELSRQGERWRLSFRIK